MPLRGLWLLLSFRWRAPLDVLATSRVRLRVRLRDLDSNLHMNNGRYFSIADFGRFDLGLRSGLWWPALRRGWQPVAGDADARFSRSLQPFQRYELQSRLLGWDDKWFFSEHRFVRDGRVCALVVVRYLLISKQGPVSGAVPPTVTVWPQAAQPAAMTSRHGTSGGVGAGAVTAGLPSARRWAARAGSSACAVARTLAVAPRAARR